MFPMRAGHIQLLFPRVFKRFVSGLCSNTARSLGGVLKHRDLEIFH